MFEKMIFPDIKNIYDYISYYNGNIDAEVFQSKQRVLGYDEFNDEIKSYMFSCGNTGFALKGLSGGKTIGRLEPFNKIIIENPNDDWFKINQMQWIRFIDKEDEKSFISFAKEYNEFVENMINIAIQECFKLSEQLYLNDMKIPTQNFINMIPHKFFTEINMYKAMLRHTSWSDGIFSKYVDFNTNEIDEAIKLFSHPNNDKTFRKIQGLLNEYENVLSERELIPKSFLRLTSFLIIRKGAIDLFSKQWLENCCADDNYSDISEYIAMCVAKNAISSSDSFGMTALTYYVMSQEPSIQDEFHFVFKQVYTIVNHFEKQKKQENFRTQLFQTSHNVFAKKVKVDIDDVDLMSGNEFENLVCILFKNMGFQSYVTKHSGDQGIDVIAEKGKLKIGIQAKCYTSTVGNSAIQEAVAGRAYYGCNRVMVVTNNVFTKAAEELASANNVVLWGREILKNKLLEYPVSV